MSVFIFLLLLLFLNGLYFYSKYSTDPLYGEGFTSADESANNDPKKRCPNILIQKGIKFFLYNSKVAKVPGVNPIEFENLEDYTEFLDWQRSQGIRCPVLFLQQTYDVQGNPVYKTRPSVTEPQGGLPPSYLMPPNPTALVDATQSDGPYNKGGMPAYDQSSYYVGATTPLDKMNTNESEENLLYAGPSANPMDSNWGGADFTQGLVDKGYYAGNEVNIAIS
jgi:hypothetical protein